jgi:hypothetical protein
LRDPGVLAPGAGDVAAGEDMSGGSCSHTGKQGHHKERLKGGDGGVEEWGLCGST